MTDIYLVRHCESMSNRLHSFAGRADVDISAKGQLQLDCLKEYFKNIKLDKIYSSPLIRAVKTAEAINAYHSLPIITEEGFIEMDLGILDGKPVSEMNDEQVKAWNLDPDSFYVEGGETMRMVADRAMKTLTKVAEESNGKTIAISSHGGVIRNIIRVIKGYSPKGIKEVDWCNNTGVNHIIYDGNFYIDFENDTSHLSEDAAAVPVQEWTED